MPRKFTLASRASQLAQIQTNTVLASLHELYPPGKNDSAPEFTASFMATAGDKNQSQALYLLGGKALWTKELEVALKEGEVDMLIHCLKDVPTTLPDGCVIAGILEREDPVDSLVVKQGEKWKTLDDLPAGSVVGTSSVRRVAQLKRKYPDLKFLDVRGNLNTRLAKLDASDGPYTALVLARAGLLRLGLANRISSDIPPPTLYYAVSQGALAIEVRKNDTEAIELCKKLTHRETSWKCSAERACLRVLEGGCSVPVGVVSELFAGENGEVLKLTGCVTGIDGKEHVEYTLETPVTSLEDAESVGEKVARILMDTGAKKILDEINADRDRRVVEAKTADEVGAIP